MIGEPNDFQSRLRTLAELQGVVLAAEEMSGIAERYRAGSGTWDVRVYASPTAAVGAREYRVVRAKGVMDVYRSSEPDRAGAVRAALNELESGVHIGGTA